jgi:hypothetical protein
VPENIDKTSWCRYLRQKEHLVAGGRGSSSFGCSMWHGGLSHMKKIMRSGRIEFSDS